VTLLTRVWKCGKSTLLALLLRERACGGQLLRRAVSAGASAVVSEEPADLWRRRARELGFGPDLSLFCRPFAGTPSPAQWEALIDRLADEQQKHGVSLVVLDPLVSVLPCSENDAQQVSRTLHSLRRLTDRGLAVLILHHPSKDASRLGQTARGSGALPAFADVLLELRAASGDPSSRRRQLFGFSRHPETPKQLTIQLDMSGRIYAVLPSSGIEDDFMANWQTMVELLAETDTPLTRTELRARWPADRAAPHETTLWRWLCRAEKLGLVERTAEGGAHSPYRYRLAEAVAASEEAGLWPPEGDGVTGSFPENRV
jgi:hypothetical protein